MNKELVFSIGVAIIPICAAVIAIFSMYKSGINFECSIKFNTREEKK